MGEALITRRGSGSGSVIHGFKVITTKSSAVGASASYGVGEAIGSTLTIHSSTISASYNVTEEDYFFAYSDESYFEYFIFGKIKDISGKKLVEGPVSSTSSNPSNSVCAYIFTITPTSVKVVCEKISGSGNPFVKKGITWGIYRFE